MPRRQQTLADRVSSRRGFIVFGGITSPQELRLSGLSSACEEYYPEYGKLCSPRNTSRAEFYRDLAERWQRRRKFTSGIYVLNVRISDSSKYRGSLNNVLACVAAARDEFRVGVDPNYDVHYKTFSVLQPAKHSVLDIEDLGELYAFTVGKVMYVYDRRVLGNDRSEAVRRLMNAVQGSLL